jgi:ribosome maturation factor RimP
MIDLAARLEGLIAPTLTAMGFALVRLRVGGRPPLLQLLIERANGDNPSIEDCAEVSRALAPVLEVADLISSRYTLEVSSPGIDRPLTRLGDFTRFAGCEAKIELSQPLGERRRFRAELLGADGDTVRFSHEGEEIAVPFANIAAAKLVLTDALLARGKPRPAQDNVPHHDQPPQERHGTGH